MAARRVGEHTAPHTSPHLRACPGRFWPASTASYTRGGPLAPSRPSRRPASLVAGAPRRSARLSRRLRWRSVRSPHASGGRERGAAAVPRRIWHLFVSPTSSARRLCRASQQPHTSSRDVNGFGVGAATAGWTSVPHQGVVRVASNGEEEQDECKHKHTKSKIKCVTWSAMSACNIAKAPPLYMCGVEAQSLTSPVRWWRRWRLVCLLLSVPERK